METEYGISGREEGGVAFDDDDEDDDEADEAMSIDNESL